MLVRARLAFWRGVLNLVRDWDVITYENGTRCYGAPLGELATVKRRVYHAVSARMMKARGAYAVELFAKAPKVHLPFLTRL